MKSPTAMKRAFGTLRNDRGALILVLFQNPLTKFILRDTMYYVKGGIVWIFS
ncbi:MAG: hypothetical protein Q4B04_01340 [bacterium]|nr:hypothetical protein [bacterium]